MPFLFVAADPSRHQSVCITLVGVNTYRNPKKDAIFTGGVYRCSSTSVSEIEASFMKEHFNIDYFEVYLIC